MPPLSDGIGGIFSFFLSLGDRGHPCFLVSGSLRSLLIVPKSPTPVSLDFDVPSFLDMLLLCSLLAFSSRVYVFVL